MIDDPVAID